MIGTNFFSTPYQFQPQIGVPAPPAHDPKLMINMMQHPKSSDFTITLEAESLNDGERDALEHKLRAADLPLATINSQLCPFFNVKKGFAVVPKINANSTNGNSGYTIHKAYFKIQECVIAVLKKNAEIDPSVEKTLMDRVISIKQGTGAQPEDDRLEDLYSHFENLKKN